MPDATDTTAPPKKEAPSYPRMLGRIEAALECVLLQPKNNIYRQLAARALVEIAIQTGSVITPGIEAIAKGDR